MNHYTALGSSEDFSVTCEGIRKDVSARLQQLSLEPLSPIETLVTIKVFKHNGSLSVETQLPFFDGAEFLLEEYSESKRGIYYKNFEQELFVILLVENDMSAIYYITQPFESFSNNTWDGATHLKLRCTNDRPVG